MRKTLLALMVCLFFVSFASAAPGAVRCGKLLDVRAGHMLSDQVVVFDDAGNITAVGPAVSTKLPAGVSVIDLSSATCLPGLIDVHTHITFDPSANGYAGLGISVPREAITGAKNARLTVRAGFTTIRNVGASDYTDVAVRDGINDGEIEGPRMLVSGPPLSITGGHCDNNLLPFEYHNKADGVADGPWAAREKVPARHNTLSKSSKPSPQKRTNSAARWPLTLTARSPSRTPSTPESIPLSIRA
jgi:hypothetical protein